MRSTFHLEADYSDNGPKAFRPERAGVRIIGIEINAAAFRVCGELRATFCDSQDINGYFPCFAVHLELESVFEERLKHAHHLVVAGIPVSPRLDVVTV